MDLLLSFIKRLFLPFVENMGKSVSNNLPVNTVQNVLIILNNMLQMHLEQFRKQQKQLVIQLVIKLLAKLQRSQILHQYQLKVKQKIRSLIGKYKRKYIYHLKKGYKLLMSLDY